jgi:hypothetical protein
MYIRPLKMDMVFFVGELREWRGMELGSGGGVRRLWWGLSPGSRRGGRWRIGGSGGAMLRMREPTARIKGRGWCSTSRETIC